MSVLAVSAALLSIINIQADDSQTSQEDAVAEQDHLLLPDLQPEIPREIFIESTSAARILRFSTTFNNVGEGPFEAIRSEPSENTTILASQVINTRDGGREERLIGEFVFHPDHEHWHIEDYVAFELWSLDDNGEPSELLASTGKMSFCIWDEESFDLNLPNASQNQVYIGCNNDVQGISVGWSDTYAARIEGQELDISDISDGEYLVRTTLNPDRNILEKSYDNNTSELILEIAGSTLIFPEQ